MYHYVPGILCGTSRGIGDAPGLVKGDSAIKFELHFRPWNDLYFIETVTCVIQQIENSIIIF